MVQPRFILFFLLAYQALFLNVLLPGHTRGEMTLDGTHSPSSCCCCDTHKLPVHGKNAPSEKDRNQCAICSFAAGLTVPAFTSLKLHELGLLDILPASAAHVVVSLDRICTYLACGPPLSLSAV